MVISILVPYAPILNPITEGDIVPCSSFKFKGHAAGMVQAWVGHFVSSITLP
jgi:hypothetical protein